jgi:hypothetical protein
MTIAAKGSSPPALQVKLSADGMASIASSKMENDFRFVVGERDYPCPWFLADFISPKIGRLHASEPSLSEFVIATPDSGQHFGEILSAGRGASLSVTEVNRPFLVSVAAELENVELYWLLNDPAKDGATVSEFCERFCESAFPETATTQSIEFIASHFFEMDQSFLAALPLSTLDRVLSDAGVLLESEDHLCEIVLMRLKTESESESESGSASVGLLGHVRFEL